MSTGARTPQRYSFHPLAGFGRRCGIRALLLALLLALAPAEPAAAKCGFNDMVGAMKQAIETTFDCEPV
jgi:hypothetical protein